MKYQPPKQGPYESSLTAEVMYNAVDDLINRYFTLDDIKVSRTKPKVESTNLWRKFRSELEEFVKSYFLGDLNEELPDFDKVFLTDRAKQKENLETYISGLEQKYGSRAEAYKVISEAFNEIANRENRLSKEKSMVDNLEGDILIIRNTREAFGQISFLIYGWIELAMHDVGIEPQS